MHRPWHTLFPSLLGFQLSCKYSKYYGKYGKALSKDSPSHQQLGLPGFALMKSTESIRKGSGCSKTTWERSRHLVTYGKGHKKVNVTLR